jgi:hypothetical protein
LEVVVVFVRWWSSWGEMEVNVGDKGACGAICELGYLDEVPFSSSSREFTRISLSGRASLHTAMMADLPFRGLPELTKLYGPTPISTETLALTFSSMQSD